MLLSPARRGPFLTLAVACSLLFLAGCGGRGAVSGNVTFNGEPVDGGTITFVPEGAGNRASAPIVNGKYEMPSKAGPSAGKNRVEILWNKKTGKKVGVAGDTGNLTDETFQVLPGNYNTNSVLTAEVKSGANTFDFKLDGTPVTGKPAGGTTGSGGNPLRD